MKAADRAFVDALRQDEESGATAIVTRAARYLAEGGRERDELVEVAEACLAAQPAMAGLLAIIKIARLPADPEPALAQLVQQLQRAPASIARHAADLIRLGMSAPDGRRPVLTLVTCSASAPVEAAIHVLATHAEVVVCCAESRPRCEGAALARRLADRGLATRLFTDAGISSAVPGSDALLLGADAVGPAVFINKVGSAALCARASLAGVPVYVLAGREKYVTADEFDRLSFPERRLQMDQLAHVPARMSLENPTFERISRQLVSQLITEAGASL